MSRSIYVKVKLNRSFFHIDTSKFLFNIIKESCCRRIAVTVVDSDIIICDSDECVLCLSDSYNFQLVTPLIGNDIDNEVIEYRSEPLQTRLQNLQELFKFILGKDIVTKIEVFFTTNYEIEALETVDINIENFAQEFEKIIINNFCLDPYFKLVWSNQDS